MKKIFYIALLSLLVSCISLSDETRFEAIDYLPEDISGFVLINPNNMLELFGDESLAAIGIDSALQKMFLKRTEQIYLGIGEDSTLNVVITGRFSASLIATGFVSMPEWKKIDKKNKIWHNSDIGISLTSPNPGFLVITNGDIGNLLDNIFNKSNFLANLEEFFTYKQIKHLLASDLGIYFDLSSTVQAVVQAMQIKLFKQDDDFSLEFVFTIENDFIRQQTGAIIRSSLRRSLTPAKIDSSIALKNLNTEIDDFNLKINGILIPSDKFMPFMNNFTKYLTNILGSNTFSLDSFLPDMLY